MAGKFSIEAIFKARDGLSAVSARIQTRLDRMVRGVTGGLRDIDRFNAKVLGGLGAIATKATAVGVIIGGVGALGLKHIGSIGGDFEAAMASVAAVSLVAKEDVADLRKEAIRLGSTTVFTATQVANAMENMGRAGFSNAEVLAGVEGILSAAAAEGMEIAEAASHISNVLKGMGLKASESGRVADVLTKASAETNSSISSLGESMKNLAPVARQMGVSLEDAVASVALLQDVGLDASEAGTATATMLTKLAQPADEVAAKMTQMGIAFKDARGDALPFTQILANFDKAAKKAGGSMDVVAFFADLVGLRGQKAALNLKEAFKEGAFERLQEKLEGAAGSAKRMSETKLDQFKGDVEKLGGAVDALEIALFETQDGPLRGVVQGMTLWIEQNDKLIKSGLVEFIERAKFSAGVFGEGAKEGFMAAKGAAMALLVPLGDLAVTLNNGRTWGENVRDLGRAFGFLAVATAGFVAYSGAVKVAQGATLAFHAVTKVASIATGVLGFAVRQAQNALVGYELVTNSAAAASTRQKVVEYGSAAATRVKTLALKFGTFATTRFTIATVASSAASSANTLVTRAKTLAHIAHRGVLSAASLVTTAYAVATGRLTIAAAANLIATKASTAATLVSNAALGAARTVSLLYAVARGTATAATFASVPAFVAANAAALPIIVTMGALAAAVGAVFLAWKQWTDLMAQTGGIDGFMAGVRNMKGITDIGGFVEGVDENFNKQAREQFDREQAAKNAAGPQTAPPSAAPPVSTTNTTNTNTTDKAEVTIKDQTGKAQVTKQPRGKTKLKVANSGSF